MRQRKILRCASCLAPTAVFTGPTLHPRADGGTRGTNRVSCAAWDAVSAKRVSPEVLVALKDALAKIYWYKDDLR